MMRKGEITAELMYFAAFQLDKPRATLKIYSENFLEENIITFFRKMDANGVS